MKAPLIVLVLVAGLAFAGTASAAPVAKASATKTTVSANEEVVFNAAGSTADADQRIVTYQWSFGDGQTATGVRVAHTYTSNGQFEVKLVIVDNKGARATDNLTVTVLAPRGLNVTHTPVTQATAGQAVTIQGSFAESNPAKRVQVFYGSDGNFTNVTATISGTSWTATIPGDAVKPGLKYYLTGLDGENKVTRFPKGTTTYDVQVASATAPTPTPTPTTPTSATPATPAVEEKGSPGPGLALVVGALALLAIARRR